MFSIDIRKLPDITIHRLLTSDVVKTMYLDNRYIRKYMLSLTSNITGWQKEKEEEERSYPIYPVYKIYYKSKHSNVECFIVRRN